MFNIKEKFENYQAQWFLYALIIFIFGLFGKFELIKYGIKSGLSINLWDMLYYILCDQYLTYYFILPLLLYNSILNVENNYKDYIIIRTGNPFKTIKYIQLKYLKKLNMFFIIWLVVGIILSSDLYDGFSWSQLSQFNNNIVNTKVFSSNEITSLEGLILIALSFYIVSLILNLIMIIIYSIFRKRNYLILTSIIIFFMCIIMIRIEQYVDTSFIVNILKFPIYIVATKGVLSFNNTWIYLVVLISIYIMFLCLNSIYSNRKRIKNKIGDKWMYLTYAILVIVSMTIQLRAENVLDITILDGIVLSFYGITSENGHFLNLLKYIITFWGVVYFAQISFDRELDGNLYYKIIRYRAVDRWFLHWVKGIIAYLIKALVILFICSIMIGYFLVNSKTIIESNMFYNVTLLKTLYQFFVNGFLQLLFYILLVSTIAWKTRNTFVGLIGLFFTMVFMLPGVNRYYLAPISLNGLAFAVEGNIMFRHTIILLIYIVINICILKGMFNRQDIK
ncbi:hypothetical protein CIW83_05355 [Tissierella sp. P1]|uniref:hypothetical protein n=1 Tax=Tissierella sp. P1 TaxID=1280483 RepID=UPI000B9FA3C9|nr:hypothetical protein [Tissierella sp. P1]OZV13301.1 hypothetical protein CIW83_05355 [Tissierella sp. P1]